MNESSKIKMLVHDARNPLNRIAMNAELVKLLIEKQESPEKMLESMDVILTACKQCNEQLKLISELG